MIYSLIPLRLPLGFSPAGHPQGRKYQEWGSGHPLTEACET